MQGAWSNGLKTRRGLTLMELVVVMVILIALAGVIVPLFPSMVTRAHTSSSATNGQEASKIVQMFEATNLKYPDGLDNLATGAGTMFPFVPGGGVTANLNPQTPDPAWLTALRNAGITYVTQCGGTTGTPANWSPTFFPYADTTPIPAQTPLSSITGVATLGTSAIATLGLPVGTYVVFGLGGFTDMKGRVMDSAPVHFSDEQDATPNKAYARLGLVFQVTDATSGTTVNLEKAKFAGTVAFHGDSVVGNDQHLAEYFNAK